MTSRTLPEWLAFIEAQHPKTIAMGLDRVRAVAEAMALPRPARRVITVAGTNGKGSTVAFVEAIARAAGWKVGAYTSPHLLRYNERVRIDGAEADDASLCAAFAAVEAARTALPDGGVPLTYFEYGTLAALWLYARADLDLAVLEIGLGGRLDAVNLVDPDVAVITTVDLDHQDWLGDDIEKIGAEKAGIARAWTPLVLGDDDPPSSVLGHAYAIGASSLRIGCDFFFDPPGRIGGVRPLEDEDHDMPAPGRWRWRELGCELDLPLPALTAPVQLRNAAVAIAALRALRLDDDLPALPDTAFAAGVADARIAARLQRFEREGVEVLVDVGHNPQAARALAAHLRAAPDAAPDSARAPVARTHAVFAALGDKDPAGLVEALADEVAQWWLAGLADTGPRGTTVETLVERLQGTAAADGRTFADVPAALRAALADARPGDRVLVFGSVHTAAAALRLLSA